MASLIQVGSNGMINVFGLPQTIVTWNTKMTSFKGPFWLHQLDEHCKSVKCSKNHQEYQYYLDPPQTTKNNRDSYNIYQKPSKTTENHQEPPKIIKIHQEPPRTTNNPQELSKASMNH